MEALLHHLIDYGIKELSFIIVNSRGQLSRSLMHKLESSVSFPVYQETDEERVWNVMQGGKDDMFVYDKCGRLTYYIPFPLSIIHEEQPIVQAAVLSTFFQSPCGTDCSSNSTFAINALDEEIPEEAIKHSNTTGEHVSIEEDFAMLTATNSSVPPEELTTIRADVDYYEFFENFTMGENATNDITSIFNSSFAKDQQNKNESSTTEPDQIQPKKQMGILSSLLNYIMGASDEDSVEEIDKERDLGGTSAISNEVDGGAVPNEEATTTETPKVENKNSDNKRDPCMAIDGNVCKQYSKRQLIQAQRCCALLTDHASTDSDKHHHAIRSCKNYGKKRCTKMMPLFKCCPKTEMQQTGENGGERIL